MLAYDTVSTADTSELCLMIWFNDCELETRSNTMRKKGVRKASQPYSPGIFMEDLRSNMTDLVSKNNQHDDTCGLSFIFRGTERVGEREGYSKRLHTIPEADCTGKNELLMMSFQKARNM